MWTGVSSVGVKAVLFFSRNAKPILNRLSQFSVVPQTIVSLNTSSGWFEYSLALLPSRQCGFPSVNWTYNAIVLPFNFQTVLVFWLHVLHISLGMWLQADLPKHTPPRVALVDIWWVIILQKTETSSPFSASILHCRHALNSSDWTSHWHQQLPVDVFRLV